MSETVDLKQVVEGDDGISVVRGSGTCRGWNNIQYKAGLSAKNVGASKLSMNVATIPPGGVAYAHIHVDFEVMLYILQGRVRARVRPGPQEGRWRTRPATSSSSSRAFRTRCSTLSDTEPVVAVVARSDASEWENIVNYDRNSEG